MGYFLTNVCPPLDPITTPTFLLFQVETSGFEFSMDNRIVVPLHSTPTLKNIYSVTVDDFTMLMLSNQQLRVKKDAAMADTSSLTAAAAISLLQGVNDTTVKAAAVEGKDKPNSFVPVLRALDLKVCQDFVDTEVKLDSLGFEISGNRKSNMSVTFSSIDVTLPPEVQLGDIGQDIAKQFKIAEVRAIYFSGCPVHCVNNRLSHFLNLFQDFDPREVKNHHSPSYKHQI